MLETGEAGEEDEAIRIRVRIDDDLCTISVDTSGAPLHRRGHKQAVNAAPMRETLAALFLRACGYDGGEPVLDPMCGSGTFPIEAAEIATGLAPGRSRHFAFERLATFDPAAWAALKAGVQPHATSFRFHGSDRDAGAIAMAGANAARAGVAAITDWRQAPVSALVRPEGPPGLVIVNPPYGARLGEAGELRPLYGALGAALKERFAGWRVGLVTTEPALAAATGLPFGPPGPWVPHGPLKDPPLADRPASLSAAEVSARGEGSACRRRRAARRGSSPAPRRGRRGRRNSRSSRPRRPSPAA